MRFSGLDSESVAVLTRSFAVRASRNGWPRADDVKTTSSDSSTISTTRSQSGQRQACWGVSANRPYFGDRIQVYLAGHGMTSVTRTSKLSLGRLAPTANQS